MNVLAVGAHPDDLELLCGGTLARYAAAGHRVVMCHATTGNRGSYVYDSTKLAQVRGREARTAADLLGAEARTLGLADAEVNSRDPQQRRAMIDLVREVRPDVVLTHDPDDYMGDHNEVSRLVFECTFHASLPLLETDHPAHDTVPSLYYMDTLAGLGFLPAEYVDISDVIDTKRAALRAHASQLEWLRDHDGVDFVEFMESADRYRGFQSGVRFAEGFRPCLTHLRARTYRVLP